MILLLLACFPQNIFPRFLKFKDQKLGKRSSFKVRYVKVLARRSNFEESRLYGENLSFLASRRTQLPLLNQIHVKKQLKVRLI